MCVDGTCHPVSPSLSLSLCWIYSRLGTPRQIISSSLSQLPPRLSLLLLFWGCCQTPPVSLLEAWLGFSAAFYLMTLRHTTSRTDCEREGGLPLTARWMPQVTRFCFHQIHPGAVSAKARRNNLFQLVELTMALSQLVTFPCLFCLGGVELLFEHIPPPP